MPEKTEHQPDTGQPQEKELEDQISQTQHTVTVAGHEIPYTALAGRIVLRREETADEEREEFKPKAAIFFVAYTRDDVPDPAGRPITFAFNGGPGSSSVWLHLGLLGPRRVLMTEEGEAPPPPYRLVDNEYSLLDASDLVFIDPVTTGYSRAVATEKPKQFHDFKQDIETVGEFIRLYTTRYNRWTSPKFLIGESYGTTRAAGLSGHLQDRHGLYLNGVMLVSAVLNFQTSCFGPGNDLPPILFLPTYAATAWYHKKLAPELQEDLYATLEEVERFALDRYAAALMKGAALEPEEAEAIVIRLARYTGLSPEYVRQTNLRINIHRFVKELLRDRRRTAGRLDSRFTGYGPDAAGELNETDPSYDAIQGPYTATLNDYVRRELAFESDLPYEILTDRVQPWRYDEHQNAYVNVAEDLRQAICRNPNLKVFVANGFYDLATPYLATRYTVNHLHLEPELRSNISMAYYEAGHMMYIHMPSLIRLKSDLAEFVDSARPA
jgi:carboxypeptidase C (cathepsin A)